MRAWVFVSLLCAVTAVSADVGQGSSTQPIHRSITFHSVSSPLHALLNNEQGTDSKCCKVCTKGKPCGDTCIAQDKTCHVGPGCAC
jgi:hypothetical protein